jgi:hypothetical protein
MRAIFPATGMELVVFCLLMGRYGLVREFLGTLSLLSSSLPESLSPATMYITHMSRPVMSALYVLDHGTQTRQSLHRLA